MDNVGRRPAFSITSFLSQKKKLEVEKHLDVLQNIVSSRKKKPGLQRTSIAKSLTSTKLARNLVCSNVLCPISTTVTVELTCTCNFTHAVHALLDTELLCGHTGIGDAMVWYGFPDALVNYSLTCTICSWNDKADEVFEHMSDSDDSENRTVSGVHVTTVETEEMTDLFLSQFIAQCVVYTHVVLLTEIQLVRADCNQQF